MTPLDGLPRVAAPEDLWNRIEAALREPPPRRRITAGWIWAMAAVTLAIGGVAYFEIERAGRPGWSVTRGDGSAAWIRVGDWLQTGAGSARISVSNIGTVEVEPNSRVRMEAAGPREQRLRLATGEIRATVSAPPRLFFVDTPASTAVDLGCSYSMKTDKDGIGLLHVTLGWVSLEWGGRESLVPAGANCRTRPKIGPGTPYFDDASRAFAAALEEFDFHPGPAKYDPLDDVLAAARVRDTLTLWHLLSRTAGAERTRVFDRIVALAPLPYGVTREKALALDAPTLKLWKDELAWKW